jgi:hypothetical protein
MPGVGCDTKLFTSREWALGVGLVGIESRTGGLVE